MQFMSSVVQDVSPSQFLSEVAPSQQVAEYIAAAISPSTRRAYQGDLKDFLLWGGEIPCSPEALTEYIANRAEYHSTITIARRLVGIGRAHSSLGFPDPCRSDLVRTVFRGLRRIKGRPQRQVAPILRDDLYPMLEKFCGLKGVRDRALVLIGFSAALRRSELVGLDVDDLHLHQEGMTVHLPRSKTDQKGEGRKIAIPFGRTSACPVKALRSWMEMAGIKTGAVFRGVNKAGTVSPNRLTDQSVSLILKSCARSIGLPAERYSGHSLRAGLVTSAARAGVSLIKIQQQTGHRSVAMLTRYIRDAQVFENNASGLLL